MLYMLNYPSRPLYDVLQWHNNITAFASERESMQAAQEPACREMVNIYIVLNFFTTVNSRTILSLKSHFPFCQWLSCESCAIGFHSALEIFLFSYTHFAVSIIPHVS